MRYYKVIKDGYIACIGIGFDGTEITAEEYDRLLNVSMGRPVPPANFDYRLKENLTWEEYPLPEPDPDPEISDNEALDIILGGETA